jgi:hypothetical protein
LDLDSAGGVASPATPVSVVEEEAASGAAALAEAAASGAAASGEAGDAEEPWADSGIDEGRPP